MHKIAPLFISLIFENQMRIIGKEMIHRTRFGQNCRWIFFRISFEPIQIEETFNPDRNKHMPLNYVSGGIAGSRSTL